MFHVGQKVVCIRTFKWAGYPDDKVRPVEGAVYTIRGIVKWEQRCVGDADPLGLYLEEIVRPHIQHLCGYGERTWISGAFRPLVEKKTDISELEKLLLPKNHKHLEGV